MGLRNRFYNDNSKVKVPDFAQLAHDGSMNKVTLGTAQENLGFAKNRHKLSDFAVRDYDSDRAHTEKLRALELRLNENNASISDINLKHLPKKLKNDLDHQGINLGIARNTKELSDKKVGYADADRQHVLATRELEKALMNLNIGDAANRQKISGFAANNLNEDYQFTREQRRSTLAAQKNIQEMNALKKQMALTEYGMNQIQNTRNVYELQRVLNTAKTEFGMSDDIEQQVLNFIPQPHDRDLTDEEYAQVRNELANRVANYDQQLKVEMENLKHQHEMELEDKRNERYQGKNKSLTQAQVMKIYEDADNAYLWKYGVKNEDGTFTGEIDPESPPEREWKIQYAKDRIADLTYIDAGEGANEDFNQFINLVHSKSAKQIAQEEKSKNQTAQKYNDLLDDIEEIDPKKAEEASREFFGNPKPKPNPSDKDNPDPGRFRETSYKLGSSKDMGSGLTITPFISGTQTNYNRNKFINNTKKDTLWDNLQRQRK